MPPTPSRSKQYKLEKYSKGLCRDCTRPREATRVTCSRCTMRYRGNCLERQYGINLSQYQEMVEETSYKCYICEESSTDKRLFVDHCHTTGVVRGLLCVRCNSGIASFRDNPALLERAKSYLLADWASRGWVSLYPARTPRKRIHKVING